MSTLYDKVTEYRRTAEQQRRDDERLAAEAVKRADKQRKLYKALIISYMARRFDIEMDAAEIEFGPSTPFNHMDAWFIWRPNLPDVPAVFRVVCKVGLWAADGSGDGTLTIHPYTDGGESYTAHYIDRGESVYTKSYGLLPACALLLDKIDAYRRNLPKPAI